MINVLGSLIYPKDYQNVPNIIEVEKSKYIAIHRVLYDYSSNKMNHIVNMFPAFRLLYKCFIEAKFENLLSNDIVFSTIKERFKYVIMILEEIFTNKKCLSFKRLSRWERMTYHDCFHIDLLFNFFIFVNS